VALALPISRLPQVVDLEAEERAHQIQVVQAALLGKATQAVMAVELFLRAEAAAGVPGHLALMA